METKVIINENKQLPSGLVLRYEKTPPFKFILMVLEAANDTDQTTIKVPVTYDN
jgi:hypothetical protein